MIAGAPLTSRPAATATLRMSGSGRTRSRQWISWPCSSSSSRNSRSELTARARAARSTPMLVAGAFMSVTSSAFDGGLDRDPFPLGHDVEIGLGPFAAEARFLRSAERNMRFVMDRRGVDVHHPGLDPVGELHRLVDALRE